jgi:predicted ATP-dependent endonuclease of OLD family
MKKNTYLLLLLLFFTTLILSGCNWGKQIDQKSLPLVESTDSGVVDDYSGVIVSRETDTENVVVNNSTGVLTQENLLELNAIRSGDIQKCDSLSGSGKNNCKDTIVYNSAIGSLKYDACATILDETMKKNCNIEISKALYDAASGISQCSLIQSLDIKANCITRFSA